VQLGDDEPHGADRRQGGNGDNQSLMRETPHSQRAGDEPRGPGGGRRERRLDLEAKVCRRTESESDGNPEGQAIGLGGDFARQRRGHAP
jgi:hypothetical protein